METTQNKQQNKPYSNGRATDSSTGRSAEHVSASIGEEQRPTSKRAAVTPETAYKSEPDSDFATRFEALKDTASQGLQSATGLVKKYPLYAALGTVGVGILAGLFLSRRKH